MATSGGYSGTSRRSSDHVCPTFLYVGASKSGSSWIYEILRDHPEVFVPIAKDLQFFNLYFDHGFDWYLSFFRKGRSSQAIGEVSHSYFLERETLERIRGFLPDVKILCCLREPVDKTISAYVHARALFLEEKTPFVDFANRRETLAISSYYGLLLPVYDLFPRENILVVFFDHLRDDPRAFARTVYSFLGVDPAYCPRVLSQRVLPARQPRNTVVAHLAYRLAGVFRTMGFANLVGRVKRSSVFESLLYCNAPSKPEIPLSARRHLRDYFARDYEDLSRLIGQPLPDSWYAEID
jgi:hypothetical protein